MSRPEDDFLQLIDDTSRLAAFKKAGEISSLAFSAQQSNALVNDVEFWKWLRARAMNGTG